MDKNRLIRLANSESFGENLNQNLRPNRVTTQSPILMKQNLMEIAQPQKWKCDFLLIFNPLCVGGQLQVNLRIFFSHISILSGAWGKSRISRLCLQSILISFLRKEVKIEDRANLDLFRTCWYAKHASLAVNYHGEKWGFFKAWSRFKKYVVDLDRLHRRSTTLSYIWGSTLCNGGGQLEDFFSSRLFSLHHFLHHHHLKFT